MRIVLLSHLFRWTIPTSTHRTHHFSARDAASGYELWKYDGQTASLSAKISSGKKSSYPDWLTVFDEKLFFSASDASGRTVVSETEVVALECEPNPGVRKRLEEEARAFLESLTVESLRAMEVEDFAPQRAHAGR